MFKKFLDIHGVRVIFEVIAKQISNVKKEINDDIHSQIKELNKKIEILTWKVDKLSKQ